MVCDVIANEGEPGEGNAVMERFIHFLPTKVLFGEGTIQHLGDSVRKWGKKAFLAIDPYLDKIGTGERIVGDLNRHGVQAVKYADIKPNPACQDVDEAAKTAKKEHCDVVIGLGGGSTIDFAKALAVVAANPGTSWDYVTRADEKAFSPGDGTLPIVAVPTTAGTGSEATPSAILSNPKVKEKRSIASDKLFPKLAVVDPELTYPRLTALTGIDALSHSIESYINIRASSYSDIFARESITLVFAYLGQAVSDAEDREARSKMLLASLLGGIANNLAGTVLPHAVAQPVGGLYDAPHGATLAACLVQILNFTFPHHPLRFAQLAEIIEPALTPLPVEEKAAKSAELVRNLIECVNVHTTFGDFGFRAQDIDKATNLACTGFAGDVAHHPGQINRNDIQTVYRLCMG